MNFKITKTGAAHLLTKRFLGPFWYHRRWLNETQWLSKEQLQNLQLKRLKKLINHCYKTVPYYQNLMNQLNLKPHDINILEDIKKFPVLTKEDVLKAGKQMVSTKYPSFLMTTGKTSGTTGTPLYIKRNLFAVSTEHAFVRRQWDWANIRMSDNTAYLSGRIVTDPNINQGKLYAYDPFMKELILSTYHLSKNIAEQFAHAIKKYNVKALIGYTSAIDFLAGICRDLNINLNFKAVLTTSETIDEQKRKNISNAFNCPVFDFYGSAERVCYIQTCQKGCYHIIPEYGFTELMPTDNGNRNEYSIIATGFWNMAMPFIRYKTKDTVIKTGQKCDCKRSFEVIDSICGRSGDTIKTPSGRQYPPTLLSRVTKGNNLLASQIIQDKLNHLIVLYIPNENFNENDLSVLKENIQNQLPNELEFDFVKVDRLEKTKSGKVNFLISKI